MEPGQSYKARVTARHLGGASAPIIPVQSIYFTIQTTGGTLNTGNPFDWIGCQGFGGLPLGFCEENPLNNNPQAGDPLGLVSASLLSGIFNVPSQVSIDQGSAQPLPVATIYFTAGAANSSVSINFDTNPWMTGLEPDVLSHYRDAASPTLPVHRLNQGQGFVFTAQVSGGGAAGASSSTSSSSSSSTSSATSSASSTSSSGGRGGRGGRTTRGFGESQAEKLASTACADASARYGELNIASVLNHQDAPLTARVKVFSQAGKLLGSARSKIRKQARADFNINDLGLSSGATGTVCVVTDATSDGAWSGGISLHDATAEESEQRAVLHYAFSNPLQGKLSVPVNTDRFGDAALGHVETFVTVSDGTADRKKLKGTLMFYNHAGEMIHEEQLTIADKGSAQVAANEIAGEVASEIGRVQFIPREAESKYRMNATCNILGAANVEDGLMPRVGAFIIPAQGSKKTVVARIVAVEGIENIIELNNNSKKNTAIVVLNVYLSDGTLTGGMTVDVPAQGTTYVSINEQALLSPGETGYVEVVSEGGAVIAVALAKQMGTNGEFLSGDGLPFTLPQGKKQHARFNGMLGEGQVLELYNSSASETEIELKAFKHDGAKLPLAQSLKLGAHSAVLIPLEEMTAGNYGAVQVKSDKHGIIVGDGTNE